MNRIEHYNELYSSDSQAFGREPEFLLLENYQLIPEGGRVLDVGAGQGRHTLWLAEKGYHVDALEPSAVAVRQLQKALARSGHHLNAIQKSFKDFNETAETYQAILIFGLISILSPQNLADLVEKTEHLLMAGGLLFVTAFHPDDPSHQKYRAAWEECAPFCYRPEQDEYRAFFSEKMLMDIFTGFEALQLKTVTGPPHRHGDGPVHHHVTVNALLKKE